MLIIRDKLLFPPPPPCPEPSTTAIIHPYEALKEKWQGSIITVVLRASNHWQQPL
jgi:hypothetical protein